MHINYSQANLSTSSYSNKRLLQIVKQGNRQSLQKLLSNNPFEDSDLNKALFECIQHYTTLSHHQDCLIILLRYKADPNCVINDRTPLMSASSSGQQILVRRLLDSGAKVDGRDSLGNYPLFYALNKNTQNFDVIQLLIDRMTNLNIQIAKKITPIGFAIRKNFDKTVKKLIDRGITPYINQQNGDTLLHFVCKQPFRTAAEQMKIVKLLVSKVGVYTKNKEGKAAFEYLHNEEIKEMVMGLGKPKVSEIKMRKVKKMKEEEEIDLSGDQLQEESSPNSKMNKIVQESDDDKKGEEKKTVTGSGTTGTGGKGKKVGSGLSSGVKGKDVLKAITKSTSNNKLRETKEVKEKEKQKQKPVRYQRKKSTKSILSKTTIKEKQPQKQKQKQKQTKQLQIIKQVTNQQITKIQTKQIKQPKQFRQIKVKQSAKDKLKQQQKTKQLKQNLQKQAKKIKLKQRKSNRQKLLRKQIQQLQQQMLFLQLQTPPEDHYLIKLTDNFYLSPLQIGAVLTQQIQDFVIQQQQICEKYYKMSQKIIDMVSKLLSNKFKQFQTKVQLFGSLSSFLCLQSSNIDLVIQSQIQPFQYLSMIQTNGVFNIADIKQVKFVKTTSFPIIKIQTGPAYLDRKIDITFHTKYHNGIKCNGLIQEYLTKMPKLRPLVLTIKQLLFQNSLHDHYTGGLGSYTTFLLVVAFLQSTNLDKTATDSLGLLLLQFLRYYGYQLDYVRKNILVYSPQYQQIPFGNNIFEMTSSVDFSCKLILYDPLNPNNNVGRSAYRIKTIQQLFRLSYNKLLLNKRCVDICERSKDITSQEIMWKPCCLLKRMFAPQGLLVQTQESSY